MISSYRLGDLVLLSLTPQEQAKLLEEHPHSIGAKYIRKRFNHLGQTNIKLITNIVLEYINEIKHRLPQDIMDSIVIHLRLGDVVAGTTDHESEKRPYKPEYLKKIIRDSPYKRYVIGACFFAETSSTNVDECRHISNIYLNQVLQELNAEHFNSGSADVDLCLGVLAKEFVQGRGFYSKLIVEIRKQLKLPCIECPTHDTENPRVNYERTF